jgi:hypothetical protein
MFACGMESVDADDVMSGMQVTVFSVPKVMETLLADRERLAVLSNQMPPGRSVMVHQRRQFEDGVADAGHGLLDLVEALFVGYETQATDQRDRISGLLGLARMGSISCGLLGGEPRRCVDQSSPGDDQAKCFGGSFLLASSQAC